MKKKLDEWLRVGIEEYENYGHRVDVYGVTEDGITIQVEVIWSFAAVKSDVIILYEAEADVKIIVVNPKIIDNDVLVRPLKKFIITTQSKKRAIVSELIDGNRVLNDPAFVEDELKKTIIGLVRRAQSKKTPISQPFTDRGRIIWRIGYPKELPLFGSPVQFPIRLTVKTDASWSVFCKLIIQSGNNCLFFKPLRPIVVTRKRWFGIKTKYKKLWRTPVDSRENTLSPKKWETFTFHGVYVPQAFDFALAKQIELKYRFLLEDLRTRSRSEIGPFSVYIPLVYSEK